MYGFFVIPQFDDPFPGFINHMSPAAEIKICRLILHAKFGINWMDIPEPAFPMLSRERGQIMNAAITSI